MTDLPTDLDAGPLTSPALGGNGTGEGPREPLDRSYLLRREKRFPFHGLDSEKELLQLRRRRRVSASFSAIPPLARNGRS